MTGYTVRRCEQLRDISRDDRARIATCSLRTLTDRLKENYSIDVWFLTGLHCVEITLLKSFISNTGSENSAGGRQEAG